MPLTGRLEVGQERLGPVHHAPEVDVHEPFEVRVGHGLDRRAQRDAGVVDDEVDRAVVGHHLLGPGVDGVPIGHVEVLGGDLVPVAPALRHRLRQPGIVDVGQGDVRAAPRQLDCEGAPDARARSGDGGHAVVEIPHVGPLRTPVRRPAPATGPENSMHASSTSLILSAR